MGKGFVAQTCNIQHNKAVNHDHRVKVLRAMFYIIILACSAMLYSTTAISAPTLKHWQQPDYIEQSFIDIALNNEYDALSHPLRRWEQPIGVQLIYSVPKEPLHAKLIHMHLQHVAAITRLDIALEENPKKANLNIILSNQDRWAADIRRYMGAASLAHMHHAVCMASFRLGQHNQIIKAVVIIPVDQAHMHRSLVTCIVEEITQVLGLPNDSDSVYPSIFNDNSHNELLTGLDGLLLKLLYHPKLESGMSEQQVRPIIRKIIANWVQDGTIEQANQSIRQGQLYPLLGY